MATTAIVTGLESLVAKLPGNVNELLSSSTAPWSSSSSSQLEGEVGRLGRMVRWIQALLDDAEEREIRERSVRLWLDELRDVAYDAEDAVEEFEYEMQLYQQARQDKDEECHSSSREERRGTGRKPQVSDPHFQEQILAQIKDINDRFDEICNHRCALKLSKKAGTRQLGNQQLVQRPPSTSLLGDSPVYGRDGDRAKVLDMLLSPHGDGGSVGTRNVSVVSILGMGGVGKTTLAQLVYNDDGVRKHFNLRSWVCVSDRFDVVSPTKEMLEAITGTRTDLQVFSLLHEKLQDSLRGRRFLLVLDDLWNESLGQWEALWKPLTYGAAGSKVLITTRNDQVSRVSGATRAHRLEGLSEDDCWSLFAEYAFGSCKDPRDHPPSLASIGRKIIGNCGGLPLAVRTLGGLLFDESDEGRWNEVLKSEMWEFVEEKHDILPALRLSYHYLPSPMKPCFAFCAVFPKDHEFQVDELVALWMAQGYIKPRTGRCMEDVGRKYVEDLHRRSFFQKSWSNFKMHDLIHDLATSVWGVECRRTVQERGGPLLGEAAASRKVRHAFLKSEADVTALLSSPSPSSSWGASTTSQGKHGGRFQYVGLRTFYLMCRYPSMVPLPCSIVDDISRRLKYLRVLFIPDSDIVGDLPASVGNLKHLRYLSMCVRGFTRLPETLGNLLHLQTLILESAHTLQELPETLGNLVNLQALLIREPRSVRELPRSLKNLVNLRHLSLRYSPSPPTMPPGIGRLTQLRTLPDFVVGDGTRGAGIQELRHLADLEGDLRIHVASLYSWANATCEPGILIHKRGLKTLSVKFVNGAEQLQHDRRDCTPCDDGLDESSLQASAMQLQEELLELIQPHPNTWRVVISQYIGNRLPRWMHDPCSVGLTFIDLEKLDNCRTLPAFGQLPSLVNLTVRSMPGLTSMGPEMLWGEGTRGAAAAAAFPALQALLMWDLPELEALSLLGTEDGGAFPRLSYVVIDNCPKVTCIKLRHLTALEKLHVGKCDELTGLDFGQASTVCSSSSARMRALAPRHMHLPRLHTMNLEECPKLRFRYLPVVLSIRSFSNYGCPLLFEESQ